MNPLIKYRLKKHLLSSPLPSSPMAGYSGGYWQGWDKYSQWMDYDDKNLESKLNHAAYMNWMGMKSWAVDTLWEIIEEIERNDDERGIQE